MINVKKLILQLKEQEQELCKTQFLAPCVLGGKVQTRVAGLVYKFTPRPMDFVGWAVFQPINESVAEVVEEASLPMISEYLQLFKLFRVRLAYQLQSQTWLAYPVNEADMFQRLKVVKPIAINLVTDTTPFEQVLTRFSGGAFWFEDIDRNSDPIIAEEMRETLRKKTATKDLQFANLTPEMRTTYSLTFSLVVEKEKQAERARLLAQQNKDEVRLQRALKLGGEASLKHLRDRGDYWLIDWTTKDGQHHTSAISKPDLTVLSSGICLSGRDRDFDLQSLVKVMEQRD
jgi:hypothetical protein